jgi:para-aminobenzoate synthetase / 4-amino-4-deoxychorismate lyase
MPLWTDDSLALIDDNRPGGAGALLFRKPRGAIEAHEPSAVKPALAALEAAGREGLHAAGFFSYELGLCLEPRLLGLLPAQRNVPLLSFGLFEAPEPLSSAEAEAMLLREAPSPAYRLERPEPAWDEAAYRERFSAVRGFIAAGDAYQINLTFPLAFAFDGSPAALFADLRRSARAGHGAYLALDGLSVLSLSPELFFRKEGARLETRPMKGTAARGPTQDADAAIRAALAADPKNRAENLMIVDLLRNDLGRIARTGTVAVDELFAIETYPTLHQMVSSITAELPPGAGLAAILGALFPCGSVTGAPKIRAMEIIHALEEGPRGIYCGAIGHLGPEGRASLNVAIRTLVIDAKGAGTLGIGSGLVFDSEPRAEYEECRLKSAFLTEDHAPFELIETFRFSPGEGYTLIEEHLARLARSASYFGFAYDETAVRARLAEAARDFAGPRRVRLTLSAAGDPALAVAAFPDAPDTPLKAVISARPVQSGDRFLFHKTSRRGFFESELIRLKEARGADEVLFLNERGEMTEGSRTNIFVERDGVLLTPALASGLLPGTLRARLIAEGQAREAVLTPADLERGTLFLGNALRGLMPARLLGQERQTEC